MQAGLWHVARKPFGYTHLEGCPVLQAQRLQRMADGWPQILPILECRAKLRHMRPAFSCHEHEHHTEDARQCFVSRDTATRLSGSDNVFDLHTAARLISDLNNICFVIDVQIMNTGGDWHGSGHRVSSLLSVG